MCGIAGVAALGAGAVQRSVLQGMNDVQSHRGPDGAGLYLGRPGTDGWLDAGAAAPHPRDARVGLAHRRLAIVDLSDRGAQPMTIPGTGVWTVFNGEIYNFQELRGRLRSDGARFQSGTDTEVLLQAYLRWGESCVEQLDGMFAFAIWDSRRGTLFCARDRLGIKPFYYASPSGFFVFASEIKALLAFPGVDRTPDDEVVHGFLANGNCDYPERTILASVRALPPAHTLTVRPDGGVAAPRRYWSLQANARPTDGAREDEQVTALHDLLRRTLRSHLISDVRAGSCLSGGLDSSAVVSMAASLRRDEPASARALGEQFRTFTSCYDLGEFDERSYAQDVASATGAASQLVFPSAADFWSEFARMSWHLDMPFGGLSYYAQWCVMRAASGAGVKVLLDGQGGDEVFGGYAKLRYAYLGSLLRSYRFAHFLREFGATIRQGDRYLLDPRIGYRYLPAVLRRALQVDSLLQQVVRNDWARAVGGQSTPATRWWRYVSGGDPGAEGWSALQRIQFDDLQIDTIPQLLRMEDRSSMAFSLEARVPLLDHRLVEMGVSLPDRMKVRDGWSKFALRKALTGLLPARVQWRRSKLGFAAPDRRWLARELRGPVTELLEDELRVSRYVKPDLLRRWYRVANERDTNTESFLGLFRVLSLEMWMRTFAID